MSVNLHLKIIKKVKIKNKNCYLNHNNNFIKLIMHLKKIIKIKQI